MANQVGYEAIKAEAKRVGWPRHYRTDLTKHDRLILARKDAPGEFGWTIRETGTDFYRPGCQSSLDWLEAYLRVCRGVPTYFYWFNGASLAEMTGDELVRRLRETLPALLPEEY